MNMAQDPSNQATDVQVLVLGTATSLADILLGLVARLDDGRAESLAHELAFHLDHGGFIASELRARARALAESLKNGSPEAELAWVLEDQLRRLEGAV